jgi:hypothetical protein
VEPEVLPPAQALQPQGPQPRAAGAKKLQALPERSVQAPPEPKLPERKTQALRKRLPELPLRVLPAARPPREAWARLHVRRMAKLPPRRGVPRQSEEPRSPEDARPPVLPGVLLRLPGPAAEG